MVRRALHNPWWAFPSNWLCSFNTASITRLHSCAYLPIYKSYAYKILSQCRQGMLVATLQVASSHSQYSPRTKSSKSGHLAALVSGPPSLQDSKAPSPAQTRPSNFAYKWYTSPRTRLQNLVSRSHSNHAQHTKTQCPKFCPLYRSSVEDTTIASSVSPHSPKSPQHPQAF